MVTRASRPDNADIGVLGGSGLCSLLEGINEVPVSTPYGDPSDPVVVGTIGDRSVALPG